MFVSHHNSAGMTAFIRCSKIPLLVEHDFIFEDGHLAVWTIAEIATTIVAASIPALRVLYLDHRPSGRRHKSYAMSTFDGTFPFNIKNGLSRTDTVITSANGKCRNGAKPKDFCPEAAEFGSDSDGKIVQVQTITVDYDLPSLRASRLGTGPKPRQTAGFEVDNVPPKAKLPEP